MCRHWNAQLRGNTCVCQRSIWRGNTGRKQRVGLWMGLVAGHRLGLTLKRKPWRAGFLQLPSSCCAQVLPSWQQPGSASGIHPGMQPALEMTGAVYWPNWMRALLLLQSLPVLCCQRDLHGNHPAGSWGNRENGVWEVVLYTVSVFIPSIPSVGADEAAAPWGVLLCSADLGWDRMGEGLRTAEEAPLLPHWGSLCLFGQQIQQLVGEHTAEKSRDPLTVIQHCHWVPHSAPFPICDLGAVMALPVCPGVPVLVCKFLVKC